jgi:hypothetical protein
LNGRWDKNDDKDSANVADLIAQGKCLFYEYPLMTLRDVRVLLALKRRLKKREHSISTSIRNNIIAQYFPELDKYYGPAETLAVVRECLDPSVIAGMEYDEFCRTVSPGKMTLAKERRVGTIWKAAIDSVGCTMGEAASYEAQVMVDSLKQIRQRIQSVDDKLEDACLQLPEYTYLLSIPGFGPDVSAKVLGAIGNPYRFTSAKQVLKMAGLDLCAKRSGKTSNAAMPVISKQGKSDLRNALYQAAFIASLKNTDFIAYQDGGKAKINQMLVFCAVASQAESPKNRFRRREPALTLIEAYDLGQHNTGPLIKLEILDKGCSVSCCRVSRPMMALLLGSAIA